MTMLMWVGIALASLLTLAIRLRAAGAARWAEMIRTHTAELDPGSVDVRTRLQSPTLFDAHELEGLKVTTNLPGRCCP